MIDPKEVTYKDVEKLIFKICNRLADRYGDAFEDILSDANLFFMKAYYSHEHLQSQFSTWLTTQIYLRYKRKKTLEYLRSQRMKFVSSGREIEEQRKSPFKLTEFLHELSKDARFVVALVLDPPPDIVLDLHVRERFSPVAYRMATRTFLKYSGWSIARTNKAFKEIRRKLRREGV